MEEATIERNVEKAGFVPENLAADNEDFYYSYNDALGHKRVKLCLARNKVRHGKPTWYVISSSYHVTESNGDYRDKELIWDKVERLIDSYAIPDTEKWSYK